MVWGNNGHNHAAWGIEPVLKFLGCTPTKPMLVFCDNKAACMLSNSNHTTKRMKHVAVRLAFLQEHVNEGNVQLVHVSTNGNLADIALGYDRVEDYINAVDKPYFGAVVGRYGNRIAKGEFTLDGETYSLLKNNGENHLHGGAIGFDKVVWTVDDYVEGKSLTLSYLAHNETAIRQQN